MFAQILNSLFVLQLEELTLISDLLIACLFGISYSETDFGPDAIEELCQPHLLDGELAELELREPVHHLVGD